MHIPLTPLTVLASLFAGILGAYLAYRRGRNPYIWFCVGCLLGLLGAFAIFFAPSRKKQLKAAQEVIPALAIQGPTDKFWYYLNPERQQVGPMSLEALTAAWQQEKISLTTYVWHEELPEWKPLQDLLRN